MNSKYPIYMRFPQIFTLRYYANKHTLVDIHNIPGDKYPANTIYQHFLRYTLSDDVDLTTLRVAPPKQNNGNLIWDINKPSPFVDNAASNNKMELSDIDMNDPFPKSEPYNPTNIMPSKSLASTSTNISESQDEFEDAMPTPPSKSTQQSMNRSYNTTTEFLSTYITYGGFSKIEPTVLNNVTSFAKKARSMKTQKLSDVIDQINRLGASDDVMVALVNGVMYKSLNTSPKLDMMIPFDGSTDWILRN